MDDSRRQTIEISANLYPIEATLKAAAAVFGGDDYRLEELGRARYGLVVSARYNEGSVTHSLDDRVRLFWQELHRQTIRFLVAERTSTLRNLIVGRALYHTCLDVRSAKERNGAHDGTRHY